MEQQEPRTASRAELDVSSSVRAGLPPVEAAGQLRQWIIEGNNYSRDKKQSFRRWSSAIRVASLLMSAAATIILGLQNLDFWAGIGFSLVALTTVTNGSEAFFNWRSRWVFAEEAQYRLYRLQDNLDYLVAKKAPDALTFDDLDPLYRQYQEIWERFSVQWLEERRRGSGAA